MIASRGVVRSNQKPQLPVRTSNTLEKKSFVIKTRTGNQAASPQVPNKLAPGYKEYPSVPSNNYGTKAEQPAPAPATKPEDSKDQAGVARQTNGFQRAVPVVVTRSSEAEKKEMLTLLARKKELEDRKSELDRMIEDEDQKNIALSNVINRLRKEIRTRTEKNSSLRSALADEERKNSRLKRELDGLTEKGQRLAETVRNLEAQVERERVAQRNFNLAERTQRIQTHYSQLRSTMSNYYDQINSALPLLMLLSNGNARLGDIMPLLMGTMGEFNNGESVLSSDLDL